MTLQGDRNDASAEDRTELWFHSMKKALVSESLTFLAGVGGGI